MSERLSRHPLSSAFPSMQQSEFEELIEDVAKNGLAQHVITLDGMVLDGWHRYLACLESDTEPRLEVFSGADPVSYVLSLNLHRRHLTASQRAAAVVACSEWAGPGNRPKGEPGSPLATVPEMAEAAGTSDRTIQQAKAAHRAGISDAVRDGKVTAKRAAKIAKLPEAERAEAIEAPLEKKPSEQPKPTHSQDGKIEALEAEIEQLRAQNDEQRESLAEMAQLMAGLQEELDAAKRTLDAEDLLGQFNQEVARAHEAARVAKSRLGGLMSENADLKKRLASALKKIQRLEKTQSGGNEP